MAFFSLANTVAGQPEILRISGVCRCRQPYYTIFAILDGSACFRPQDAGECRMGAPGLFFLSPGRILELTPDGACTLLTLHIRPEFLLHALDTPSLIGQCLDSHTSPALQKLFSEIRFIYEQYQLHPVLEGKIVGSILQIVWAMESLDVCPTAEIPMRQSAKPAMESLAVRPTAEGMGEGRISRIISYIKEHIREPLGLQETARAIGYTPQYLANYFQKNFGCTFMDYVSRQKAETAWEWLSYTSCPDSELTGYLGFKSAASFRKCVSDCLGCTADELRQKGITDLSPLTLTGDTVSHLPEPPAAFREAAVLPPPPQIEKFPEPLDIPVTPETRLPASWNYLVNIGYVAFLSDYHLREQLRAFQKRLHFRYGRICRPLDLVLLHSIQNHAFYSFELVYQSLDFILSLDLIPFLEIGSKDVKANASYSETFVFSPEQDYRTYYKKLLEVLPAFLRGCCNRYGTETVSKWQFEVYYEGFEDTKDFPVWQFANYYRQIETIIHSYVPKCRVGCLGFNTHGSQEQLAQALAILKQQHIKPDFFSIYIYGSVDSNTPRLSLNRDLADLRTRQSVRTVHEAFPGLPVLATEFSFSHISRNFLNDTVFQSLYIARYLTDNLNTVKGMGYFLLSDVSARYIDADRMLFGGNGLLNLQGIRKPSFYAFSFYGNLGRHILAKGDGYIITANSRYSFQGIFFNYAHITAEAASDMNNQKLLTAPEYAFESIPTRRLHFHIRGALPGIYAVKSYCLNEQHGNLLPYFSRYPHIADLSDKDVVFFNHLAHPAADLFELPVKDDGILTIAVTLKPMELLLLLFDHNTSS